MSKIYLIGFILFSLLSNGQTCLYKNLSKSFDFKIELRRIERTHEFDTCIITLRIIKKETKKENQKIEFGSGYLFETVYKDCSYIRSYETGINKNKISEDNDFGDLIVADFNFDGKEDFAVKKESGGNGGPIYQYYIQNEKEIFILDKFLSNTMEFFPSDINKSKKP